MKPEDVYPNIEVICRLCLKANAGTVSIYNDHHQNNAGHNVNLSIPMRIMACVALEVQANDGLPKNICTECRYQLEKSYLLRKQSQESDVKLRKHIRLLSLGKPSKVFRKGPNDDDDDDELEFYDSLVFIKQHEDKIKMEEELKLKNLEDTLRAKNESELKKCKDKLKAKCKEELRAEVEQSVKNELRKEIQEEIENQKVPKIKMECLREARKSLRNEVIDECRKNEMQTLLYDLQSYLKEKQISRLEPLDDKVVMAQNILSLRSATYDAKAAAKRPRYTESFIKVEEPSAITMNKSNNPARQSQMPAIVKPELILSDNPSDMAPNVNDDDGDSDNFFIFDTDEAFEVQKKSGDGGAKEDNETLVEDHIQPYESSEEQMTINNSQEVEKTSTISYRIEDSENGDITFLKNSSEFVTQHENNDNTDEQLNDANIMIINYPNEDDEEHLDMMEYIDDDDDGNKALKPVMKRQTIKRYTSKESDNTGDNSPTPGKYTTVSTLKTTLLTKTFVNTSQRVTDTPKLFKCNDCPMAFSTNHSLERHLRTHRKVEATGITFQCPECQIVVSCTSALRRHMFIHCEQKPFTCVECGKSFVQKEILKRHMQSHTGAKPHKCPHCDRDFAQRMNLQQHINRLHMEEPRIQQHSCHLCPKRFNHASGLSRHLAAHSGVAFQCSECDRTFGDRSSIKRHIANKHVNGKIAKSDKHPEYN